MSPYARGLYPVTSHDRLRLFQTERWSPYDDEIRVEYRGGEFVVEHHLRRWPRPLAGAASITRCAGGFAAVESALRRACWSSGTARADGPRSAPPPSAALADGTRQRDGLP